MCRSWIVRCQAELGEFDEGVALGEEGIRIAEEAGHPFSLVTICFGLGALHLRRGDLSRAADLLDRSLGLSRRWEYRSWFPPVASLLGLTRTLTGTGIVDEGLQLLEQAVEEAEAMGLVGRQGFRFASLAEGYLRAGRTEEANRLTRRALELSREKHERGSEAWTLRLLGEIGTHEGSERAEDDYRQTAKLAEELGMRPLVAHCHLGLGKLHRRAGKRQEAQEKLGTAIAMYRAMDMRFWLETAHAEMQELA
jgi:tetratricopeptide (TPR) repeat protein